MSTFLMIYASMSGNTEGIAKLIEEGIVEAGGRVELKEIMDATPQDLLDYEGILLGSYTWGDGELPDEFLDFYEDMNNLDLSGKKVAVFGSGDHAYIHYCAAVDILETKVKELGAELVQGGLKIEMSPYGPEVEECKNFGKRFASQFLGIK
ncbi:flavodoxin [Ammoniphilus sp. YIM 78166]|uniref:flavodoxin n=1 Tax=Ammoniphilus sp. YIM 78166 TaxID=1644106 RepID=UPI00106F67BC|nr:flavodoxin [Ammoniphilus sp. YIM 78166]